jgi:hypothetical protein
MFYVDHEGAERAERRRQDDQRALEGYYQKAVQAGTVEAAGEFVTQASIYASNAFKPSQVYPAHTDAERAMTGGYVDKAGALLEALSASHPDQASTLVLRRAELFEDAARWDAALVEIRRALAMPEVNAAHALHAWTILGRDRGQPAMVLEACRTLGPRLPQYDFATYAFCVDESRVDEAVALAWASEADLARFQTDRQQWQARMKRDDAQFNHDMKRQSCRQKCTDRYGYCLSHGSDCEDKKQDCLALCKVRFGEGGE